MPTIRSTNRRALRARAPRQITGSKVRYIGTDVILIPQGRGRSPAIVMWDTDDPPDIPLSELIPRPSQSPSLMPR